MSSETRQSIHGTWRGRWTFILAAAGSAVGLGNIWKFPYMAGEYGGGAFVLVYLACILLIGVPIMVGEILIALDLPLIYLITKPSLGDTYNYVC